MSVYSRWVERDLQRWRQEGWVSEAGAEAIRRDLARQASALSLQSVFALLGAALLILAGATFVAANWDAIPRPGKLGLFLILTWSAYGAAFLLERRGSRAGAEAAALTGVGLFGADIMLIGQMYHMGGAPEDAVLLWALGGLAAGVLLRSAPVLTLTALLFTLWGEWDLFGQNPVGWGYAAALMSLCAAFFFAAPWRGAFHLLAILFGWFLFTFGFRGVAPGVEPGMLAPAAIGLGVMAGGVLLDHRPDWNAQVDQRGRAIIVYGFILAALSLLTLQFIELWDLKGLGAFGPYAGLSLLFLIGGLALAMLRDHHTLLWWAIAALAVELCGLYLRTVGSLLETALFFLMAAALVIGVAVWSRRRREEDGAGEEGAAP